MSKVVTVRCSNECSVRQSLRQSSPNKSQPKIQIGLQETDPLDKLRVELRGLGAMLRDSSGNSSCLMFALLRLCGVEEVRVSMLRWSPVLMATLSLAAVQSADTVQAQEINPVAVEQTVADRTAIVVPTQAVDQPEVKTIAEAKAIVVVPEASVKVETAPVETVLPATPAVAEPPKTRKIATQMVSQAMAQATNPPEIVVPVTVAQPIVSQPTVSQPTVSQPTVSQQTVAQTPIAQADQDTPNKIQISPDQPPTGTPTIQTPPPATSPETALPPSEIELPQGTPTSPLAPGNPPAKPPADSTKPEPRVLVAEVKVTGATGELENTVYGAIRTRPGQTTTRTQLQEDINAVFATGFFANVQAAPEDTPLGVRVTFVVEPNPVLKSVQVQGSSIVATNDIEAIFKPQYGSILNLRQLQQGIQTLTKNYQDKGYVLAKITDVPKISPDGVVTLEVAEGQIEGVQIKYINKEGSDKDDKGNPIKGRTRDFVVTREMETKPGGVFNRNTVERDLQRIFGLGIFEDVKVELDPGNDPLKVNVVVNVAERNAGSVAAGAGISSASGLFGTVSYQQQNLGGNNQKLGAELQIGQRELLFDASFTDPWIANDPFRTSYTINGFRRRSISLIYDGGDDIRVVNDGVERDRVRVVRTGGGITFSRPLSKEVFKRAEWNASLGFQYQQVKVQDADGDTILPNAPQTNEAGQVVGIGSDLSFSGEGKDDLFTVQFGLLQDKRNDPLKPTRGSRFSIGTEQSIPIGKGSIFFNRLRASYSYYVPTRLLKISPACRDVPSTLVTAARPKPEDCPQAFAFNVQAGTVLGDLPPYEAFSLGGSNSVRGYEEGDVGAGKSFLQASAEYRFPIFSIVSGALFLDAATDFGTGSSVKGNPAGLRNKPGGGIGYGLGVRVQSPLGPIRVDYGFNDQGDSRLHFGIGERF
jgi:outer membrane protein insertion porin family